MPGFVGIKEDGDMKQNYDTIIGIDPDCDRSGAAVLDIPGRRMAGNRMFTDDEIAGFQMR